MAWKRVNNSDPGDSTHHGGDSTDKIGDLFSGVDVDDVDINADWKFRSSKKKLMNPANTFGYTEVASAIAGNRNVTEPLLTGNDTRVYEAHTQTLTNKTVDAASNTVIVPSAYKYTIYLSGSTTKCRDNDTGLIVSSNTNASVPIQYAIDNAVGKPIFIQRGSYNCGTSLDLTEKYTTIHGEK